MSSQNVTLFINKDSKGTRNAAGKTLGQFVKEAAQSAGLRNFSVYVDGEKVDSKMAKEPISTSVKEIQLIAKDARGFSEQWSMDTMEAEEREEKARKEQEAKAERDRQAAASRPFPVAPSMSSAPASAITQEVNLKVNLLLVVKVQTQ